MILLRRRLKRNRAPGGCCLSRRCWSVRSHRNVQVRERQTLSSSLTSSSSGTSGSCPSDSLLSSSVVCRNASSICDRAETCSCATISLSFCEIDLMLLVVSRSGTSASCPTNLFSAATTGSTVEVACLFVVDHARDTAQCVVLRSAAASERVASSILFVSRAQRATFAAQSSTARASTTSVPPTSWRRLAPSGRSRCRIDRQRDANMSFLRTVVRRAICATSPKRAAAATRAARPMLCAPTASCAATSAARAISASSATASRAAVRTTPCCLPAQCVAPASAFGECLARRRRLVQNRKK